MNVVPNPVSPADGGLASQVSGRNGRSRWSARGVFAFSLLALVLFALVPPGGVFAGDSDREGSGGDGGAVDILPMPGAFVRGEDLIDEEQLDLGLNHGFILVGLALENPSGPILSLPPFSAFTLVSSMSPIDDLWETEDFIHTTPEIQGLPIVVAYMNLNNSEDEINIIYAMHFIAGDLDDGLAGGH